jgi:hypothetical protein
VIVKLRDGVPEAAVGRTQSKPGLRGAALRRRLLTTADDRGARGYDSRFANGRLNVYRAVTGAPANVRL